MPQSDAIAFLNTIHDTLASQTDLSPNNPKVNSCLSCLVATLQSWQRSGYGETLADQPDFAGLAQALPGLCAKAECEMEKWWCRRILASECPGMQALTAFWYLDNYEELCETELQLLGERGTCRFAFLGSGALPLTAILLAQRCPDTDVTCVDCDGDACELAQDLVALLGLSERVAVKDVEARAYWPQAGETIICASLLNAPGLFDHLSTAGAQKLIVRDAEGPYRFCYRPARLPGDEYIERAKSPLSPERINTSRYFEARAHALKA
jgi:hypothetical protein